MDSYHTQTTPVTLQLTQVEEKDLQQPRVLPPYKMVSTVLKSTIIEFVSAVPSGQPQSLIFSTTSRTLTFSWSPPLLSQRNGVIISYLITCSSGGSIINSTRTSSTSLTITGLQPFTNYTCSVRAATIVGDGPATMLDIVTSEESKKILLQLY